MNDQSILNGKVRRITLPAFDAAPGPDAPIQKRLLLPQGELAQFIDGSQPLRYVAAVELRPGSIRGNHYHLVKHESLYVFSGDLTLLLADLASSERAQVSLTAGDLVAIPPGIAHTLRVLRPGLAIEFSPEPFDPQDTCRFPLA